MPWILGKSRECDLKIKACRHFFSVDPSIGALLRIAISFSFKCVIFKADQSIIGLLSRVDLEEWKLS